MITVSTNRGAGCLLQQLGSGEVRKPLSQIDGVVFSSHPRHLTNDRLREIVGATGCTWCGHGVRFVVGWSGPERLSGPDGLSGPERLRVPRQFCSTTLPYPTDPIKRGETTLKVSAVLSTVSHVIVLLGTLLVPTRGDAQISPLFLEVRGGGWIPTSDLVGAQGFEGAASTDASVGVHFVLRSGRISFVAGFSEQRFGCTAAQCNEAVDFVSTAWDLGVRVNFREAGMVPWVSLGGTAALFDAHVDTGGGFAREASDRGWGYEVGAGVLVPVGRFFALDPGVRYGRSDADFATRGKMKTRYIIADVGLVLAF